MNKVACEDHYSFENYTQMYVNSSNLFAAGEDSSNYRKRMYIIYIFY